MKKVLCLAMALLMISAVIPTFAADEITVTVDGSPVVFDVPPIIDGGRTLVPLRAIFEALNAEVNWDGRTKTVTAKRGDTEISLTIGKNAMTVNGATKWLDVPAKIVDSRTLVPVRAVSESLGVKVDWDGATRTVIITSSTVEDFETKGYLYESTFGDSLYFVTVKNNTGNTVEITGNALAYDANGNALGADTASIDVLGSGEQSIMYFYFSDVTGIATVDYSISHTKESYYYPIINDIKLEQTVNDKNLTVRATNNGKYSAMFVEAYALFFDSSGELVYYSSEYITDGDYEIKPGATLSAQLDAYKDFDYVECYLTGRSTGGTAKTSSSVSDNDFSIKEYATENSFDSTYYLVIKNNSQVDVSVSGNATAFDANGGVLGADDCSINVLGAGEETITYFYFSSVKGIDHIEYTLSYDDDPYYSPVLSGLDVVQHVNDKNVVVTVKNNGEKAAKFLEVHALFFDANNNVVAHDSTYLTDGDYELKPGATLSAQLDAYQRFDHVECYFDGRN